MSDEIPPKMIEIVGGYFFRLVWWRHLDPTRQETFADDLFDVICEGIIRTFDAEIDAPQSIVREMAKREARKVIDAQMGGFANHLPDFTTDSFENIALRIAKNRGQSKAFGLFADQYDRFTSKIANLSESLIDAVKLINEEFIIWLKTHPSHTERIHADAFEQLSGEILASHGFSIQFTGRIKNLSADLIAIRTTENDEEVKYLIECKRFKESRKVDLHIVNAVIGASCRARVEHAMLLTTSTFTSSASKVVSAFEDIRLELHDGEQINEWLADYEFKDMGLWLPEGWQDDFDGEDDDDEGED